jgi:hypothetical protein
MPLELDTSDIEACLLRELFTVLEAHGLDGACVVVFKGRESGMFTTRRPGNPVTLAELRELARQTIDGDQADRGERKH